MTVLYGTAAAVIAWLGNISSVLQLVLLGFAMVVPPAIAVGYVFYWRRTTEQGVFWGMATGFAGGLVMWLFNTLFGGAENATAGGFAQAWYELITFLGEWRDPSFLTLMLPMIVIPAVSLMGSRPDGDEGELSLSMSGWVASSETSTGPEFFTVSCLPESEMVPGSHSFSPAVCRSHQPTALWPRVRRTLGKIYPVNLRIAYVKQAVGNVARILNAQSGILDVEYVVGIVGEDHGGDILLFSSLSPEALDCISGSTISQ